jgi:hypothetical protein
MRTRNQMRNAPFSKLVGLTGSPSLGRINGFDQDEAEGESDE